MKIFNTFEIKSSIIKVFYLKIQLQNLFDSALTCNREVHFAIRILHPIDYVCSCTIYLGWAGMISCKKYVMLFGTTAHTTNYISETGSYFM